MLREDERDGARRVLFWPVDAGGDLSVRSRVRVGAALRERRLELTDERLEYIAPRRAENIETIRQHRVDESNDLQRAVAREGASARRRRGGRGRFEAAVQRGTPRSVRAAARGAIAAVRRRARRLGRVVRAPRFAARRVATPSSAKHAGTESRSTASRRLVPLFHAHKPLGAFFGGIQEADDRQTISRRPAGLAGSCACSTGSAASLSLDSCGARPQLLPAVRKVCTYGRHQSQSAEDPQLAARARQPRPRFTALSPCAAPARAFTPRCSPRCPRRTWIGTAVGPAHAAPDAQPGLGGPGLPSIGIGSVSFGVGPFASPSPKPRGGGRRAPRGERRAALARRRQRLGRRQPLVARHARDRRGGASKLGKNAAAAARRREGGARRVRGRVRRAGRASRARRPRTS